MTDTAAAGNRLRAIEILEKLEARGELRPAEKQQLHRLRAGADADRVDVDKTGATYRGFRQGATFNLADEAYAALKGYTSPDRTYDEELEATRARDRAAQGAYPDEFKAGEYAGAASSAVIPLGTGAKMAQGLGLLGKTAIGAGVGGATGFAQGFGAGEDGFVNRAEGALPSTVVGALIGGAAPGVARLSGAATRRMTTPAVSGAGRGTTRRLMNTLEQYPDPQAEIIDHLRDLGPEGMLADVPGGFRARAQGLAAIQGEGGAKLSRAIEERAKGTSDRIETTANEVLGQGDDAYRLRNAQEALRREMGGPMYEAALSQREPLDVIGIRDALDKQIETAGPATRGRLQELRGEFGGKTADAGEDVVAEVTMSAERLHNIRSDLSDTIAEADRAGRKKQVAALTQALKRIDATLDRVPGYAGARKVYADSYEVERAADAGRAALDGGPKTAVSPQELRAHLATLKPGELEAFRKGVREYVYARMGTARNGPSAALGDLGKEWNREKLAVILGEDEARKVFQRLGAEKTFAETRTAVNQGSQTQMDTSKNLAPSSLI